MNNQDYESEALIMAQSVKFLRKKILSWKAPPFTGQFPPNCQESSVPTHAQFFCVKITSWPKYRKTTR